MLKRKATVATLWSGADVFVRQGTQVAISIALARFLTPSDFGTIAVLLAFSGIASVVADLGMTSTIVHRSDASVTEESTAFWLVVFSGAISALLLLAVARPISRFYSDPRLEPLAWVISANIAIASFGVIPTALLMRSLKFKTLLRVGLIATMSSGALAITLAARNYGVWALCAQMFSFTAVSTALVWFETKWRPLLVMDRSVAKEMLPVAARYLAANFLEVCFLRVYNLIIGKRYGAVELGYYSNADTARQAPAGIISAVLSRVAFPMFAHQGRQPEVLARAVQFSNRTLILISAPLFLGAAAVSNSLIEVLYGSRWLPSANIFRILCYASVLLPVHVINVQLIMAVDQGRNLLRLEVSKKVFGVAALLCGVLYGVEGLAWSQLIYSLTSFYINCAFAESAIGYGLRAQLRDILPPILCAGVMALACSTALKILPAHNPSSLLAVVSGAAAFFIAMVTAFRLTSFHDLASLLKRNA